MFCSETKESLCREEEGNRKVFVGVKNGYFEINGYDYFLFTDFSQNIH